VGDAQTEGVIHEYNSPAVKLENPDFDPFGVESGEYSSF
jgi:hypothetical protein